MGVINSQHGRSEIAHRIIEQRMVVRFPFFSIFQYERRLLQAQICFSDSISLSTSDNSSV